MAKNLKICFLLQICRRKSNSFYAHFWVALPGRPENYFLLHTLLGGTAWPAENDSPYKHFWAKGVGRDELFESFSMALANTGHYLELLAPDWAGGCHWENII